jgi:hypothetical protein
LQFPYSSPKLQSAKIKNNYKITIPYLLKHNKEHLSKLLTIGEFNELQIKLSKYVNDFQGNEAVKKYLTYFETKYNEFREKIYNFYH